jgi:hypothetical protein
MNVSRPGGIAQETEQIGDSSERSARLAPASPRGGDCLEVVAGKSALACFAADFGALVEGAFPVGVTEPTSVRDTASLRLVSDAA